jgi:hypothetical protein
MRGRVASWGKVVSAVWNAQETRLVDVDLSLVIRQLSFVIAGIGGDVTQMTNDQ